MSRICVFGDSISWGAEDLERGGWVDRFKVYFKKTGKSNEVFNLGNPGRETGRILEYIDNECKVRLKSKRKRENIIMIQVGTNDSCFIKNEKLFTSPEKFRENIKKLIKISKKYVDKIIFVGLPPVDESKTNPIYWNPDFFHKNKYIRKYNQIIKSVCKESDVEFIDIFGEWIDSNYKKLLEDGLHPNSKGHEKIFKTVRDFLVKREII